MARSAFVRQMQVLGTKNFLLAIRNWKGTVGQLLAPVVVIGILFGFQLLSNLVLSQEKPHPSPSNLVYPKCIPHHGPCTSIIYTPNNTQWVNLLMQHVADRAGLEFGVDVVGMGQPGELTTLNIIADNATLNNHIVSNPNRTQHAILFTTAYLTAFIPDIPLIGAGLPLDVGYVLLYNATASNPYHMEFMHLIDETALLLQRNVTDRDASVIDATYTQFPVPQLRIAGYDVVASNGGVWFYVPPMITFFIILTELVMEKENHLRLGMRTMGLNNAVYWIIWFVNGIVFNALGSLILIAAGSAFQFAFFLNSNFFALFIMFFFFGMSMLSLAFMLSTMVSTTKTAQTMGYAIILVGFVFQVILCSANGALIDLLYADEIATWVKWVRVGLTFYPPFNLAMAFSNVAFLSSDVVNIAAGMVTKGPGFFWHDMFTHRSVGPLFGMHIVLPAVIETIACIVGNAAIFLVFSWYFDNVLAGPHGAPRPPYFFLTREYWGLKEAANTRGSRHLMEERGVRAANDVVQDESIDVDVRTEARHALDACGHPSSSSSSSSSTPSGTNSGVHIVGLSKIYHSRLNPVAWIRSKIASRASHRSDGYSAVNVNTDDDTAAAKKTSAGDGDLLAVDRLSMSIEEGQIFCILGHNGAGKTTTINMMTGLFPPTAGHARIYGHSVLNQMDEIRKTMGVCPQHDILWGELTAREHLRLFAKLKGIDEVETEVLERLDYMGLTKVADHRVGSFSGGMKRRLSVAIAAIGNPRVIFLDEPTTGMDPVNRAAVWHMIQNMKQNRVIVLTTHSMEEADILSDRVCIMSFGKLCAIGDSLHLKEKYGSGYRIHVTTSPDYVAALHRQLSGVLPDIVQGQLNAGSVTWHVSIDSRDRMPAAIQILERQDPSVVREWGVACSSLEEVFIDVTKSTGFEYEHLEEVLPAEDTPDNAHTVAVDAHGVVSTIGNKPPSSNVFRALMRKNFSLQKRQTGTNVCQILTPILVMGVLVLLQIIIRSQIGPDIDQSFLIPGIPLPLNIQIPNIPLNFTSLIPNLPTNMNSMSHERAFFQANHTAEFDHLAGLMREAGSLYDGSETSLYATSKAAEAKALGHARAMRALTPLPLYGPQHTTAAQLQESVSDDPFPFPFPFAVSNVTYSDGNCLEYFYFSDNTSPDSAGFLDQHGNGTLMLGYIEARQRTCYLANLTRTLVPYFQRTPSWYESQQMAYDAMTYMNQQPIKTVSNPPTLYMLPDAIVDFQTLDYEAGRLAYTFSVNENPIVRYHRKNNFTRVSLSFFNLDSNEVAVVIPHGQMAMMDLVHQAFSSSILNQTLTLFSTKFCQTMPYYATADILAILEAFGTILYPVALTLQLPVYIYILAMEKSEKLKEMMKQHGMKTSSYIFTNYLFDLILYTAVIAFFWIAGAAASIRFFTQTHWLVLVVLFVGWAHALISLAFLLSAFVSSKRGAVIVGYVVALLGTMMGVVFAIGIYGDIPYVSLNPRLPTPYLIWPQFGFVRAIYLLNSACALKFQCYGPLWTLPSDDELIPVLISLYLCSAAYFIVYLYLDQVIPSEFGVPKHPLFFLGAGRDMARSCLRSLRALVTGREERRSVPLLETGGDFVDDLATQVFRGADSGENHDVTAERERVYSGSFPSDSPLVTVDLRKEYPAAGARATPKLAVHNLTMSVNSGQCFGLLGENGAGKTTTISILTGLITPTSGTARVGGYNILNEIDAAHLVMGVCPQFNILWDTLTVREHMLFYARLKGVPTAHEEHHVDHMLRELGLSHTAKRHSSALSGGMKRRLSIGIALVGYSRIVFLDEPTTGLDPASRRQLWSIIGRAKRGRAIVLTTHSMEEAELLCDNIGIMAHGRMRALGTQQHLKTTVGAGYHLRVSFKPVDEAVATGLVLGLFPSAKVVRSYRGWAVFELGRETRVSEIFAIMERDSDKGGILDWSCDQIGLEEVFQRVVHMSRSESTKEDSK